MTSYTLMLLRMNPRWLAGTFFNNFPLNSRHIIAFLSYLTGEMCCSWIYFKASAIPFGAFPILGRTCGRAAEATRKNNLKVQRRDYYLLKPNFLVNPVCQARSHLSALLPPRSDRMRRLPVPWRRGRNHPPEKREKLGVKASY